MSIKSTERIGYTVLFPGAGISPSIGDSFVRFGKISCGHMHRSIDTLNACYKRNRPYYVPHWLIFGSVRGGSIEVLDIAPADWDRL